MMIIKPHGVARATSLIKTVDTESFLPLVIYHTSFSVIVAPCFATSNTSILTVPLHPLSIFTGKSPGVRRRMDQLSKFAHSITEAFFTAAPCMTVLDVPQ